MVVLVTQSYMTLRPHRRAPLSMEFPRQEYWNGLPCLPSGDIPGPGTEPSFPTLQADTLPSEAPITKI